MQITREHIILIAKKIAFYFFVLVFEKIAINLKQNCFKLNFKQCKIIKYYLV